MVLEQSKEASETEEFIGRKRELSVLQEAYDDPGSVACAVYGRRKIGKTTLIDRFCEDKPSFYTRIVGVTPRKTLEVLREDLGTFLGEVPEMGSPLDLFSILESVDGDERTVVVIDEFPELAEVCPEIPGALRRFIERSKGDPSVLLIACGRTGPMLSLVEGPLSESFDALLRVDPMQYVDARLFHPGMSEEDRVRMYAVASGVPFYHAVMDRPTVEENISEFFLGYSRFTTEADDALMSETRSWRGCQAVLTAIACGHVTEPDIWRSTRLSSGACRRRLQELESLGIVDSHPNWGRSRPRLYEIADGIQLLHRQVLVGHGRPVRASYDELTPSLEDFYGRRFRRICLEYLEGTECVVDAGTWRGSVPRVRHERGPADEELETKETASIDIVTCLTVDGRTMTAFGECGFASDRCGTDVAEDLVRRSGYASRDMNRRYYIFSRSGFTPELEEMAGTGTRDIRLVSMDDIRAWAEGGAQDNTAPDDTLGDEKEGARDPPAVGPRLRRAVRRAGAVHDAGGNRRGRAVRGILPGGRRGPQGHGPGMRHRDAIHRGVPARGRGGGRLRLRPTRAPPGGLQRRGHRRRREVRARGRQ